MVCGVVGSGAPGLEGLCNRWRLKAGLAVWVVCSVQQAFRAVPVS